MGKIKYHVSSRRSELGELIEASSPEEAAWLFVRAIPDNPQHPMSKPDFIDKKACVRCPEGNIYEFYIKYKWTKEQICSVGVTSMFGEGDDIPF
ncbi:MAG: hypothetical protein AABY32_05020 [Nanoarchaeota archaeon]